MTGDQNYPRHYYNNIREQEKGSDETRLCHVGCYQRL